MRLCTQALLSLKGKPDESFDVYFDSQKIDIFKLCLPCLREVQRFVSEHGNAVEVFHTLGQDQKDLLMSNMQLARAKAR